jgi:hypothetical protein
VNPPVQEIPSTPFSILSRDAEISGYPEFVESIGGSAFANSDVREVWVAEENRQFRVSSTFFLTFDGQSMIRDLGRDSAVQITREIEVVREDNH